MTFKTALLNSLFALATLIPSLANAQLIGHVGPLTSSATKAAKKTCNVLNYGGVADGKTDVGPAITSAWNACKTGGVVVIPEGNFALGTWVSLSGGSAWALQLDGTIIRTGTAGGNMIFVQHTSDFELFSSHGTGAMQGLGYQIHTQGSITGARLLRFYQVTDFSVHDIKLVDAPAFHFSMDTCKNGEVYNMAIRGGNSGGLDGIDVWSDNMHIHDIMVTNKDECVTVKVSLSFDSLLPWRLIVKQSPAHNVLVENIYCNWSGGCAFGSLGANTDIANIAYRNVYTWSSNQMLMIKSNGGSGTVNNASFANFIGHGNAYSLDIDQYWSSMDPVAGNGVKLTDISFTNWKGGEANGQQRGPIKAVCADVCVAFPCPSTLFERSMLMALFRVLHVPTLALMTSPCGQRQVTANGTLVAQHTARDSACVLAPGAHMLRLPRQ